MRPVLTFLMSFSVATVSMVHSLAAAEAEPKPTADSKAPAPEGDKKSAEPAESKKPDEAILDIAVELNNQGVKLVSSNQCAEAVCLLSKSLTIQSNYELARKNLSIALNNKGLNLRGAQILGLAPMLESKMYEPDNKLSQQNIQGMMRLMSLDPNSFEAWRSVIQKLLASSDYTALETAVREAQSVKGDAQIKDFLELIPHPIVPHKQKQSTTELKSGSSYINLVSAAIKKTWTPPAAPKSARLVVDFDVDAAGKVSNLKIVQTGTPEQVLAAKKAVMTAKLTPPPTELQKKLPIKIRFTFDKNVHAAPPPDPSKPRPDTSDEHVLAMLKERGLSNEWIRFSLLSAEEHLAKYRFAQASALLKGVIERFDEPATANDTTLDKQLLQRAALRRAEAEAGLKNNDEAEQLYKRAIELASATDGNKFYEQEAQQKYGKFLSANAKGDQGEAAFKRSKELFDELMSMIK